MSSRVKSIASKFFALVLVTLLVLLIYISTREVWHVLSSVNADLAIAVITAAATVITATITVMLGRYYERKREIEVHFRAEKIKIYDEFLSEVFKLWYSENKVPDDKLVEFLREWQRKIMLWGGSGVLRAYIAWMIHMKQNRVDAQSVLLMDKFFRALRSDIGQHSFGLPNGAFAHFILRHGSFFLAEAAKNPSITLAEIAKLEKERFGEIEG